MQATPGVIIEYGNSITSHNNGLVKKITDAAGYEEFTYDALSRVASKTRRLDALDYTTSYLYNQANQTTRITYPSPSNRQVNIEYDERGRLNGVAGYLSSVTYNAAQQVTGLGLANGVNESYDYSAELLQLTSQTATKGSTQLMSLSYGYNATLDSGGGTRAGNSGQLMTITGNVAGQNRDQTFKYNQVGRLAATHLLSQGYGGQTRYTYKKISTLSCNCFAFIGVSTFKVNGGKRL